MLKNDSDFSRNDYALLIKLRLKDHALLKTIKSFIFPVKANELLKTIKSFIFPVKANEKEIRPQ